MREHGRKVSQQRFAQLAGYSKRTQERYETGQSEPRQSHLERIVALTGVTRDYFFTSETGTREIGIPDDDEESASMPLGRDHRDVMEALYHALAITLGKVDAPQGASV